MKTLKKTVLTFAFLFVACTLVKADLPNVANKKVAEVLVKFIESSTEGQPHDFRDLLSDDFIQYIDCDKKRFNFDKREFISYLKLVQNAEMNCTTDYSLIEEKEDFVIAKVDMKYPTFTRTNYVTMRNSGEEWKITNISVHFEN